MKKVSAADKETKINHVPFHSYASKLARDDEKLIADAFVKTEGFDKSVVFFMSLLEQIWQVANKYKSFRMELYYDAEALNTNYAFFVPIDQSESDGKCPESSRKQD